MALARVTYVQSVVGNRNFAFSFPYLSKDYIKVKVNGVNAPFTWLNTNTIQLTTAPAVGATVEIERRTEKTNLLTQFNDGSTITESDLNRAMQQSFHLVQETDDISVLAEEISQSSAANSQAALNTAEQANDTAAAANATSNSALSAAQDAVSTAAAANATSNSALSAAQDAVNTANTAEGQSAHAVNTANTTAAQFAELEQTVNSIAGTDFGDFAMNSDNLSGLVDKAAARANLGLSDVTNDAQLKAASNLADLTNVATARTNLGLGIAARVDTALSLRNKIINGNFDFWQRGTSLTAATAARYLADRWLTDAAGNTTILPSRIDFSPGHILENNNPRFAHRAIVAAGTAGANNRAILIQRIEGVRTLAGRTVTLTFWGRADIARSVAIEFAQVFGTGGSPSTAVTGIGAQKVTLPGSDFTKFSVTVAIPSILGKTIGTNGDDSLQLLIWFSAGSNFNSRTDTLGEQSGTFDIAQVQLEEGAIATPFEQRPVALELALCRRYYNPGTTANWFFSNVTSGSGYQTRMLFSVPMRATPTITLTHASSSNFPATTGLLGATIEGFTEGRTANGTGPGHFISNWTADAEL